MCKQNPITTEHILLARASLLKRMANPDLTQEQLLALREQYDYIVKNVHETPGSHIVNDVHETLESPGGVGADKE